jgi:hypothetical protein
LHRVVYGSKKKQQTIIQAKQFVNIEARQCVGQARRVSIETNQLLWTVHRAGGRAAGSSYTRRCQEGLGNAKEIRRLTPARVERCNTEKNFYPNRARTNAGQIERSGTRHRRSRKTSPVGGGARRTSGACKRNRRAG